ncbi:hypothetical protein NM208_g17212 [Fusarium decemcellulare]|uniref:Uncharacterized protein n=1 Tax=Fusarium decemcellulare TaxID=57161 RepID=A0ACC1RC52_9HYPO|nr:hypothetical protein NM208_g17212 [Fusarium decemcellulare]
MTQTVAKSTKCASQTDVSLAAAAAAALPAHTFVPPLPYAPGLIFSLSSRKSVSYESPSGAEALFAAAAAAFSSSLWLGYSSHHVDITSSRRLSLSLPRYRSCSCCSTGLHLRTTIHINNNNMDAS